MVARSGPLYGVPICLARKLKVAAGGKTRDISPSKGGVGSSFGRHFGEEQSYCQHVSTGGIIFQPQLPLA